MSAKDQMAMMLNELMGPRRNQDISEDAAGLNYKDTDVCKFFLADFCPHEMFTNTKADLGPCNLIHDETLRVVYRQSKDCGRLGYERQLYNFVLKLYDDMRRRIQRNKERLALTQGDAVDPASKESITQRMQELDKEIAEYLAEAEQHGAIGSIEKSQECIQKAESLTEERDNLKKTLSGTFTRPGETGAKPMEVCETCGCFLIIGDVQQRIEEHMTGKQHLGFARIADTIKELEERFKKDDDSRRRDPGRSRGSRDRDERSRSRHRDRESGKRDKKDSSRERKRSRDRRHKDDNKNGSDRSKHRRSRSHSREHRRRYSRSPAKKSSRSSHRRDDS
jgi:hypothetical protein